MRRVTSLALWIIGALIGTEATSEESLRLQPRPPSSADAKPEVRARATLGGVNGIGFIDVMTAAGFDLAGADYGSEPALAVNPLNPAQIVLTSFSGSDWAVGGNSSLFYSDDGGSTWTFSPAVPPPTGTATNVACPCDQTMDWGRNGVLYGTFLWASTGGTGTAVYSAQTTTPTNPASWVYRAAAGQAQTTSQSSLTHVDQPWLMSGPLPGDNGQTNVCVAYDNFNASGTAVEIRAADSPAFSPLDFTRDAATHSDGQPPSDGMNPGNRMAVGPDGLIWNVFQRWVGPGGVTGVQQLTYLVSVSADGGQTWSVANADHASGAKILAANVYSFQGYGSKVAGVNALLGGVTAIAAAPSPGTVWIVYGRRNTPSAPDLLFLVPVTYSNGNLTVGTARPVAPPGSYLPSVAVLPNGEVGVLFVTFAAGQFNVRFAQTIDGGMNFEKLTTLTTFASPFADNGDPRQRILGDYLQVKPVACEFFGAYPARGDGVNSVTSIDPYFMRAPAATPCAYPTIDRLSPTAVCAGQQTFSLTVIGTELHEGSTARVGGALRMTGWAGGSTTAYAQVLASDVASPGLVPVDILGPAPAGVFSDTEFLSVETLPGGPGNSLRAAKNGGSLQLDWSSAAGATFYRMRRCNASTGPCTPETVFIPFTNSYSEATLNDGQTYWYQVAGANSCGDTQ